MKKFISVILILAFASIALILGCANEGREIRIGFLGPYTGNLASWGDIQKRAIDLAIDNINNAGGIKGHKVKPIYEDGQGDPKIGVSALKKLAEVDRVPIVVGSPASNVTLAIAPIANDKKVVLLSDGSTAMEVGKAGLYIFRIMPSDEVQAKVMAGWMMDLGYSTAGVLYVENSWGRGLMEAFTEEYKAQGGKITTVQSSDPTDLDYRSQLSKIKAANPSAIYAPLYTDGASAMLKQAKELRLKQQIFGADVYGDPALVKAAGEAAEGVLFTRYGEYHGKEYQEFAEKYEQKYGENPETYATYVYDAVMIAAVAIGECNLAQLTGEDIRKALLDIKDYRGASGLSSFEGSNSASGKSFDKLIIKGGEFVPYGSGN